MSEHQTIRVNFGAPMPLFPLHGVVLLPHAVIPLHVFEPRYRQMIERTLDSSGQIAMAIFEGDRWKQEYHGSPSIRPIVCVGQIVQHEKLPDGRYNVLLQGVCRAAVEEEQAPDADRLYRVATLRPIGRPDVEEDDLPGVRERMRDLLSEPPLTALTAAQGVARCLEQTEAPMPAILELIAISIVSDNELKYQLLAEPDPVRRASLIEGELETLRSLLTRAAPQLDLDSDAPKGCTWN